jgi:hypothetical protein
MTVVWVGTPSRYTPRLSGDLRPGGLVNRSRTLCAREIVDVLRLLRRDMSSQYWATQTSLMTRLSRSVAAMVRGTGCFY